MDTEIIGEIFPFSNSPISIYSEQMAQSNERIYNNKESILGDLSTQHHLERLIHLSVEKISIEKKRPSGANLHKSLLICDVIFKARVSLISMNQDQTKEESRSTTPAIVLKTGESEETQTDNDKSHQENTDIVMKQISSAPDGNEECTISEIHSERFTPTPFPVISQTNENIPPLHVLEPSNDTVIVADKSIIPHQKARKRKWSEAFETSDISCKCVHSFGQDQFYDEGQYMKKIRTETADSNNNTGSETSQKIEQNDLSPQSQSETISPQQKANIALSTMNIFPFSFIYPFPLLPNFPHKLIHGNPEHFQTVNHQERESSGTSNRRPDFQCLWCSQSQVFAPFGTLSAFQCWLVLNNAAAFWSSAYNQQKSLSNCNSMCHAESNIIRAQHTDFKHKYSYNLTETDLELWKDQIQEGRIEYSTECAHITKETLDVTSST